MSSNSSLHRTQSFGSILGLKRTSASDFTEYNNVVNQRSGNTTSITCALYIAKICTGAGLLGLPSVYDEAGVVSATVMTVILVVMNIVSCRILIKCRDIMLIAKQYNRKNRIVRNISDHNGDNALFDSDYTDDSYNHLAYFTLGRIGIRVVDISIIICLNGVVALYLITYTQLMTQVFNIHSIYFIVIALIILLPTVFIHDISGLSFISILSTIAYIIAFIAIFSYGFLYGRTEYDILHNTYTNKIGSIDSLCRSFGTLTFSLGLPVMSLTLQEEMIKPSKFKAILNNTMFVVCIAYITIGFGGVIIFNDIQSIIISNLPSNSIISNCVKIIVAITLLLSCPLSLTPSLNLIEHLCFHNTKLYNKHSLDIDSHNDDIHQYGSFNTDNIQHNNNTYDNNNYSNKLQTNQFTQHKYAATIVRCIVLLSITTIAFIIPCFKLLMSSLGCISFSLLCFILPSMMYIQLHHKQYDKLYVDYMSKYIHNYNGWSIQTHAILNYIYVILGVIVSIVSTYEVLSNATCQ